MKRLLVFLFMMAPLFALQMNCSIDSYGHVSLIISDKQLKTADFAIVLQKGHENIVGETRKNAQLPYIWHYSLDEPGNYTCVLINLKNGRVIKQTVEAKMPGKVRELEEKRKEKERHFATTWVIAGLVLTCLIALWLLFGGKRES